MEASILSGPNDSQNLSRTTLHESLFSYYVGNIKKS